MGVDAAVLLVSQMKQCGVVCGWVGVEKSWDRGLCKRGGEKKAMNGWTNEWET